MSGSRLVNRNVVGQNGRTSMRLEPELWDALREICRREQIDVGAMVRRIEAQGRAEPGVGAGAEGGGAKGGGSGGRTSRVRVFIVQYFRAISGGKTQDCEAPECEAPDRGKPEPGRGARGTETEFSERRV